MSDDYTVKPEPVRVKTMTTYEMADGSMINGEFSFVVGPEFFDDVDEPTDVIVRQWLMTSEDTVTFKPAGYEP